MISFKGRPREEMVTLAVTMYTGRSTRGSSMVSATLRVVLGVLHVKRERNTGVTLNVCSKLDLQKGAPNDLVWCGTTRSSPRYQICLGEIINSRGASLDVR